ncbi:MAG: hypothetical protein INH34_14375 [Phycisphaerales bacterium]|nr:hypothetical protein [Phycisphaerales bacterium]
MVGPISIDRVRFRAANNNVAVGGTYNNVNFAIGTSASNYLAPRSLRHGTRADPVRGLPSGAKPTTAGESVGSPSS